MTSERKIFRLLTSKDVCRIYELLYSNGLISFPITSDALGKIDSVVGSITGSFFGFEPYVTAEEKAVAYFYFLIKDHPFTDGNKRTASLTFDIFCALNNLHPNYDKYPLDGMAVFIEKIQVQDHAEVIRILASAIFEK